MLLARVTVTLVLLAGAVACSGATSPEPTEQEVLVSATALPPGDWRPGAAARGGPGRIRVEGRIDTPSYCHDIHGRVRRDGRDLVVEVQARPQGVPCTGVVGWFWYEALVHPLPPALYQVRVRHAYPGTSRSAVTMLEQQVLVE